MRFFRAIEQFDRYIHDKIGQLTVATVQLLVAAVVNSQTIRDALTPSIPIIIAALQTLIAALQTLTAVLAHNNAGPAAVIPPAHQAPSG